MADVDLAFTFVMKNEDPTLSGKVVPEPKQGKARFGVNSRAHPEAIVDGFYEMDKDKALAYAKDLFVRGYWTPIMGDRILNQLVANKIADLAFNLNPKPAVKVVQRAINLSLGSVKVFVDGQMGTLTLTTLNSTDSEQVLKNIRDYAKQYYRDIAYKNPNLKDYLDGWLNRVDV